jgi:formate dehydrogenase major subunit
VPGGFHLTNAAAERTWNTASGKANFIVFRGTDENPVVDDPMMLRMATLRSHDQYNTTIYSLSDRYRGVHGTRMVVFMNEADMAERGIAAEQLVEIETLASDRRRVLTNFKALPYNIPRGSIASYYPETNALMPLAHHDETCQTPAAKSIPVVVRAMAG